MSARDEPVDGLVPADDLRVTAFRRWLVDADQWSSTRAEQKDLMTAWDEAGALIGGLRDIVIATPLLDVMRVRSKIEADADATTIDTEWSKEAKEQRWTLIALKRAIADFGPAFLGPGTIYLAGDLDIRAKGSPSPLDDKIPRARAYGGGSPRLNAAIKPQTIRLAHWLAGRNGSSWRDEHRKICPRLTPDQQTSWNRLLDKAERDDCRRVGALIRQGATLSPEDEIIAAAATRWGDHELRKQARNL
jgi:hypothetical protein